MKKLIVFVELNGKFVKAGTIRGNGYRDASFCYDADFLNIRGIKPISISLPLQEEAFTPAKTKAYFEGLLPEGFSRRAVAGWAKADQEDYLTILAKLGQECLGALRIVKEGEEDYFYDYSLLNGEQIKALAAEGATKSTSILMETHLSLTGATGKVGLYHDQVNNDWYLPIGCAASTHIVKQSHVRYRQIVLNEQLCIRTAKRLGISVPNTFIVNVGKGTDDDILFATERYDRKLNPDHTVKGLPCPFRQHQEDFCQALGISAADKYETEPRNYLGKMFELVRDYSSDPIADQIRLWDNIVFNYLIGNTDCHIKNYSLLYNENFTEIRLAPAYDMVCTMAYGIASEMSFFIGGELEIDKISRDNFKKAAREAGIGEKMAMGRFDRMQEAIKGAAEAAADELGDAGFAIPEFWRKFTLR